MGRGQERCRGVCGRVLKQTGQGNGPQGRQRSSRATHVVVMVLLNVWIDDGDHLSASGGELLLHLDRLWEFERVPCEVALAVGVFNVQPGTLILILILMILLLMYY